MLYTVGRKGDEAFDRSNLEDLLNAAVRPHGGPGSGTRCRSVREIPREELGLVVKNARERGSGNASDFNPRRNPPPGPIDTDIDVAYQSLTSSQGEGPWGSPGEALIRARAWRGNTPLCACEDAVCTVSDCGTTYVAAAPMLEGESTHFFFLPTSSCGDRERSRGFDSISSGH